MNSPAAYGIYPHNAALNDVVSTLNQAGFVNEDICMMLSPSHPVASIIRDAGFHKCGRESTTGAAQLIGWFSEFGAVMIPTVGFFIRSVSFFHALLANGDSPRLCGNSTTLMGLGFSEDDAIRFETQLREAGVLVYVTSPQSGKIDWAIELMRRTGAREAAPVEHEEFVATVH